MLSGLLRACSARLQHCRSPACSRLRCPSRWGLDCWMRCSSNQGRLPSPDRCLSWLVLVWRGPFSPAHSWPATVVHFVCLLLNLWSWTPIQQLALCAEHHGQSLQSFAVLQCTPADACIRPPPARTKHGYAASHAAAGHMDTGACSPIAGPSRTAGFRVEDLGLRVQGHFSASSAAFQTRPCRCRQPTSVRWC